MQRVRAKVPGGKGKARGGAAPLIPFVDLGAQYRALGPKLEKAARAVLSGGDFILGGSVEAFEREFAAFVGARHAVAVSSGLDALRLALAAVDVGPGDEVILPANTFIATALAVSAVGARPVLADVDPRTYELDPALVEKAITPRTRALLPVHLAGNPVDMDPLLSLARRRGLRLVEDAAQAHGARYKGRSCGTMGELGCFSFYPAKNLGACGDGGAVVTSDDALARRLRRLRHYGQEQKNVHLEKGLNARLDTLQAALLRVKLPYLARANAKRAAHAQAYRRALAGLGDLRFQRCEPGAVYHLFIVETARRDELKTRLEAANIQVGLHYPTPIHLQPAYAELGYREGAFPVAERLAKTTLSLPMFPELTKEQLARVVGEIRGFFEAS